MSSSSKVNGKPLSLSNLEKSWNEDGKYMQRSINTKRDVGKKINPFSADRKVLKYQSCGSF